MPARKPVAPIRLITLKSGRRLILKQVDFRDRIAHCCGEVTRAEGLRTHHAGCEQIPLDDVASITTVQKTWELVTELFNQGTQARVAKLEPGQSLVVSAAGRGTATAQAVVNNAYDASDANRCGLRVTGRRHTHVTINKPAR